MGSFSRVGRPRDCTKRNAAVIQHKLGREWKTDFLLIVLNNVERRYWEFLMVFHRIQMEGVFNESRQR